MVNDSERSHGTSVPASLLDPELEPFWIEVATRLGRNGNDWRGTVRLSAYRPATARLLTTLVGRPGRRTIDLGDLESELIRLGVGADLTMALASLGHPVSPEPAERRARRAESAATRAAVRAETSRWPDPWASAWADDVIRAGLTARLREDEAIALVGQVRQVLDAIDALGGVTSSRTELAATVTGSSHALDDGTVLERSVARALACRVGSTGAVDDPWSTVGLHRSLLVGAALTWRLPLQPGHPLAVTVEASNDLHVPYVVTRLALDTLALDVDPTVDVLVVENPRVIEYAAQIGANQAVLCGNGNPSTTVTMLIDLLVDAGSSVRYHGDFDAAGIGICARMHARGLTPWMMSSTHYLTAVVGADNAGVALPVDTNTAGETPWDPDLSRVFNERRQIVHEERLLDVLFEAE